MDKITKFQQLADAACLRVKGVLPGDVDDLAQQGAVVLDIRDSEEFKAGHIPGALNISRGKLEMIVESEIPDLASTVLCYCNAINRGALAADTLQKMGYSNAKYIDGGLSGYQALMDENNA